MGGDSSKTSRCPACYGGKETAHSVKCRNKYCKYLEQEYQRIVPRRSQRELRLPMERMSFFCPSLRKSQRSQRSQRYQSQRERERERENEKMRKKKEYEELHREHERERERVRERDFLKRYR